jgi:protein with PEP-CTERM/exosortase system signal
MAYRLYACMAFKLLRNSNRPSSAQQNTQPPKTMKNRSKTVLAILATGLLSCTLFSQQARATPITGNINFAGSVTFDTHSLLTATTVTSWINTHVEAGGTGNFAGIPVNPAATFTAPWVFDSGGGVGGPHPALWSVAGYTFDLLSSTVTQRTATSLTIEGTGIVSGNGFDPTAMSWSYTTQNAGGGTRVIFSFSANGVAVAVPDGGSAIAILGIALIGIEFLRRKLRSP